MFIVFDYAKTKAFGPFEKRDQAEEWLARQGVYSGDHDDQEVAIMELQPITAQLELI